VVSALVRRAVNRGVPASKIDAIVGTTYELTAEPVGTAHAFWPAYVASIFASAVLTEDPPLFRGLFALGFIYVLQHVIARLRIRSNLVSQFVDNAPILVMDGSTILEENLSKSGITREDLRSKLREANVLRWEQVQAVVVETTGDVTVLHASDGDESTLDRSLLAGVRGVDDRS
jgi:phosphate/sulfate permease